MNLIFLYHIDLVIIRIAINQFSFMQHLLYEDQNPIVSLGLHLRCFGKLCCFTFSIQILGVILCVCQVAIRGLLLPLLDDPHRKICTAIGMAVASIAHYDWPEDWPDLLPSLMKCITDQTNMNAGESFVSPYYELKRLE